MGLLVENMGDGSRYRFSRRDAHEGVMQSIDEERGSTSHLISPIEEETLKTLRKEKEMP